MNAGYTRLYHHQLKSAESNYRKTGNRKAYYADCGSVAAGILASSLAESDPTRFRHLPSVVNSSRHLIKAGIDLVIEDLECPIDYNHDPESFLRHFWGHVQYQVGRELQPLKDLMEKLGIG